MKIRGAIYEKFRRSLSSKLLALTILFVFIAEVVVLVPSVSKQRLDWLNARLEAAYLVGLALDSPSGEMIEPEFAEQLFGTANILGVALDRDGARLMVMTPKLTSDQAQIVRYVNLKYATIDQNIAAAWATMFSSGEHSVRVVGKTRYAEIGEVDMFVSQTALRRDLRIYARNVLFLSLIISTLTASLLFWSLNRMIVRPVSRLTKNMAAFENAPEDELAVLAPSRRLDEIGAAERSLSSLEKRLQSLLTERRRLAALGSGISKISHDLRNILASAQLMSDRLAKSEDPRVRKLSPRLISALDRAIALSRDTLNYARMEPGALKIERVGLKNLIDEVFEDTASLNIEMRNNVEDDVEVDADPTQLYRAIFNIVRNAVDALSAADGAEARTGRIDVAAFASSQNWAIAVSDDGPGIPEDAKAHLFEPFKGSKKPGGSGLGVAIAHEIARAHGGELTLAKSDQTGATFKITLPVKPQ
ncbi:MAG: HAMP domain-containing sensor histidine kinase [Parvularculaceae bacterium]|nr:HAMP domain-containing histidine kinase [Parvularculaceae bacterium]